jgi:hypothetical protein
MHRDSYHSQADHFKEVTGPFASRVCGKRYDPYTRRYVDWMIPADWSGQFIDPNTGLAEYPRFTADEARKIWRETRGGRRPLDPQRMGSEWYHDGPKVCCFSFQ